MSKTNPSSNIWKAFFLVSAIGVDFAVCVLVGYWFGAWMSRVAGGQPLWIVMGLLLGLILGFISVILLVKPFMEDKHE